MNHKQKIKIARKMRTRIEVENKTPIFQSEAWENRKKLLAKKNKKI